MKRLLNNITDSLADAAMLEMSVDVSRTAENRTPTHMPLMATLKRFFQNFSIAMADAALLEIGVSAARSDEKRGPVSETLEENFIEVAFAEAADYDDIHEAMQEHRSERDIVRADECQYGDNEVCFV